MISLSRSVSRGHHSPAGADRNPAAFDVENRGQHVPRPERRDAAFEAGAANQPFEDRDVRVGDLVVAVDPRIGATGEHFAVTGI